MSVVRRIDFWTALGFLSIGAVVLWIATGFDARSRVYPMSLAAGICVISAGLLIQTLFARDGKTARAAEARIIAAGPGVQTLIWGAWAAFMALGGGYIEATVLAVTAIVLAGGRGRPGRTFAQACAIAVVVYAIFHLIFDVPLPMMEFIADRLG